jgi:putative acetyltransferase
MNIKLDDLSGAQIQELLRAHLANLAELSPPESMHALNLDGLRRSDVTFWSVWEGDALMGCGALKELNPRHGEVKSMRTVAAHLRKGVATRLLARIAEEARRRGYSRLSLETGVGPAFYAAHGLYEKLGFRPCGVFGDYKPDPNSRFFTMEL